MWNKLPFSDFYIYFHKANLIEIYLTDFISIWSKYYTSENFLKSVKENNETLEGAEEYELLSNAIDMLVNVESLIKVEVAIQQGTIDMLLVKINTDHGYPVKLKLNFKEDSKELFFQKITYPLLQSTQDFVLSQNELCKLLENKDKEINVYKKEGCKISLRHKTPVFDQQHHMSFHNKYSENFAFTSVEIPSNRLLSIKNNTTISMFKQELLSDLEVPPTNKETSKHELDAMLEECDLEIPAVSVTVEVPTSVKVEPNTQSSCPSSGVSPRKKLKKRLQNL